MKLRIKLANPPLKLVNSLISLLITAKLIFDPRKRNLFANAKEKDNNVARSSLRDGDLFLLMVIRLLIVDS